MTQELLDLKRLYWNLRRFRIGRRKGQTPYGLLGLNVPDLSFWEFLKLTPEELREKLSALEDTLDESLQVLKQYGLAIILLSRITRRPAFRFPRKTTDRL